MKVLEFHAQELEAEVIVDWLDDADVSVALAVITRAPDFSLQLVRATVASEANAAFRTDVLSHAAARILRDFMNGDLTPPLALESLAVVLSRRDRVVARRILSILPSQVRPDLAIGGGGAERLPAIPGEADN